MAEPLTIKMDADALNAFLARAFPDRGNARMAEVAEVRPGHARLHFDPGPANLRPGGVVSGPTLMTLADTGAYAVILAHIGEVAMAVTSTLSYNFLRACEPVRLTVDAELLKLGRRLAVVDIRIWTRDESCPVGQANVTYAIP